MEMEVLKRFEALIRERGGLSLRASDVPALQKTLHQRRLALRLDSPEAYLDWLAQGTQGAAQEWGELWKLLTNQETYFGRDGDQLGVISGAIWPDLARRNRDTRTLRLWSAGCSTGEEPYSLAMMLEEAPEFRDWRVSILGTDISEAALSRARRGVYGEWSFRALDATRRARFFTPRGKEWEVAPCLRRRVQFALNNLFADPFPAPDGPLHDFDLIVCRNVFIYFDRAAVASVLRKFSAALRPGGFLVCGHAELHDVPLGDLETRPFPQSVIYQRAEAPRSATVTSLPPRFSQFPTSLQRPISTSISTARTPTPPILPDSPARAASSAPRSSPPRSPASPPQVALSQVALSQVALSPALEAATPTLALGAAEILKRATTELRAGRTAAGLEMVQSLLEEQPQSLAGWCLLAQAQADAGHLDAAQQSCERALRLAPMAPLPHLVQARIAEERGEGEAAKALWKKVMYLNPDSVWAPLELSAIYRREGDGARATQMQRAALGLLETLDDDAPVPAEAHCLEMPVRARDLKEQLKRQLRAELQG